MSISVGELITRLNYLVEHGEVNHYDECILVSNEAPIRIQNVIVPKVKIKEYSKVPNAHIAFIEGVEEWRI
jgi:hypothetical protein